MSEAFVAALEPVRDRSRDATACWHCGLPVPGDIDVRVDLDGAERPMCCHGCAAAACFLRDAGLDDYYRLREARTGVAAPAPDAPGESADWAEGELGDRYVTTEGDEARAELALGGMRCAACAWLLESGLGGIDGVRDVDVALATGRVVLRWDPQRTRLGTLVRRVRRLGFVCVPARDDAEAELHRHQRRRALRAVGVSGVVAMQVMMLAVADYAGLADPAYRAVLLWAQMVLASVAVLTCTGSFFDGARRALAARTITMDVPVALAITLAWGASVLELLTGGAVRGTHVWFDSVTMFIFFLRAARWVELDVRQRFARADRGLAGLLPALAHRERPGNGGSAGVDDVPTDLVETSEIVRVRPGETIPVDGRVLEGGGAVDTAALTGESAARRAVVGDAVEAGGRLVDGALRIEVSRPARESAVAGIPALLARARTRRARAARHADRAARWLLGAVLVACALAGLVWSVVDPSRAFSVVLATLIATCPCALALATPTALAAAGARLRRHGVLVTDPDAFESIAQCDAVCFDKTGTLTRPSRIELRRTHGTGDADAIVAALEAEQTHPLAEAARRLGPATMQARDIESLDGRGIGGWIDGTRWRFGHASIAGPGDTCDDLVLLRDTPSGTDLVARYARHEVLADEAMSTVDALRRAGLAPSILSGDDAARTRRVADALAIDDAVGELRPADKLAELRARIEAGRRVLYVGDGINDAPVLGGATASVAVGTASDYARAAADVVLLDAGIARLDELVRIARATRRRIRLNLTWAFGYNALVLPLALTGVLVPWMAAIGMSASSLVIVLASARLLRADAGDAPWT